jgi:hypothetical protein
MAWCHHLVKLGDMVEDGLGEVDVMKEVAVAAANR